FSKKRCALFQISIIAFLAAVIFSETAFFAFSKLVLMLFLMFVTVVETKFLIPSQIEDTVLFTVLNTIDVFDLIFSQAALTKPLTASTAPENTFLMPSQIFERAFFMFSKMAF